MTHLKVLTTFLNEETGKIEPHRINGLLDMGVKPVFKLTTEDGRSIRTTGNHPYLTKEGWKKVIELSPCEEIAVVPIDDVAMRFYDKGVSYGIYPMQKELLCRLLIREARKLFPQLFPLESPPNFSGQIKMLSTRNTKMPIHRDTLTVSENSIKNLLAIEAATKIKYVFNRPFANSVRLPLLNIGIASFMQNNISYLNYICQAENLVYAGLSSPFMGHFTDEYEFSDKRAIWLDTSTDRQIKTDVGHSSLAIGQSFETNTVSECDKRSLFAEENKKSSYNCPELTHNKSECPTDNFSFGFGNFNTKFRTQFFNFKGQTGFGIFNPVFNMFISSLADNISQCFSATFTKFVSKNIRYSNNSHSFLLCYLKDSIDKILCQVKNTTLVYASTPQVSGDWLKVIYLEGGDQIAVVNGFHNVPGPMTKDPYVVWDKIVSIEYIGYEHVYDIEVEGTHNFVAGHWLVQQDNGSWIMDDRNPRSMIYHPRSSAKYKFGGIVAHNTYISGNVGIGTTGPTEKLEVSGNIKCAKWMTIGVDLAETMMTKEILLPGMVVSIDRDIDSHCRVSQKEYDSSVAGVISTQPGSILGGELDGALVALVGSVPTWVDASYGDITRGDLLVSSPTPGCAMKLMLLSVQEADTLEELKDIIEENQRRQSAVIGKALESVRKEEGRKLINVWINLM